MRRPDDDVHLTYGTGFLTEEVRYQNHLKAAIEIKEVIRSDLLEGDWPD
jgi:hypothetical protein